jgi:hypothetical protein
MECHIRNLQLSFYALLIISEFVTACDPWNDQLFIYLYLPFRKTTDDKHSITATSSILTR